MVLRWAWHGADDLIFILSFHTLFPYSLSMLSFHALFPSPISKPYFHALAKPNDATSASPINIEPVSI
jgi:hypothetical protein